MHSFTPLYPVSRGIDIGTLLQSRPAAAKLLLYPGMVPSTDGADQVFGELYRMRDAAELLRVLDEYEGCSEKHPKPHEYVRARVAVTTGDGATVQAWTYLYNRPVAHLPRIASGRFLDH